MQVGARSSPPPSHDRASRLRGMEDILQSKLPVGQLWGGSFFLVTIRQRQPSQSLNLDWHLYLDYLSMNPPCFQLLTLSKTSNNKDFDTSGRVVVVSALVRLVVVLQSAWPTFEQLLSCEMRTSANSRNGRIWAMWLAVGTVCILSGCCNTFLMMSIAV